MKVVKVFTLVNAEVGKAKEVLAQLKKTGLEVYPLFGAYDFLVIAETVDLKTATATILEKIQAVRGVTRTRTLVGAEI
ncbi:MAG: Lrp/AsnC family transcriptional regulator [Methanophagales archaeon ANME-1-THS]|nr:MAG: Lrp/AsnC family transcriptional regulator [Methanophagales archaeon ANME-1-THS]